MDIMEALGAGIGTIATVGFIWSLTTIVKIYRKGV